MNKLNVLSTFGVILGLSFLLSCGSDDDPTIDCSVSDLAVTVQSTTDATCQDPGTITVAATGGDGTYEFSIDGAGFQSSTQFINVAIGSYTLIVRDGNGCTANTPVTIGGDVAVITITSQVEDAGGCNETQGQITVTATGGDGTYEYSINGGSFGSSNVFTGLGHGEHSIEARDGDGCSSSRTVNIKSGISYANSVQGIISSNCAISGCHVSGTGRADFSIFATIQANASAIKSRTQSGDMPRGRTLTQDEVDRIACWVDDGAPSN